MHAIILAGGFGTRLQSQLPDLPKSLAPIQGKPFLSYLLDNLKSQGITHVILSVHYLAEKIIAFVESCETELEITFAKEDFPLLTGGAIVNALSLYQDKNPVFVLNGDTFVKLDYQAMAAQHLQEKAELTMALVEVKDHHRYGKVTIENNRVMTFGEAEKGWVNAGVYLIQPDLFSAFSLTQPFSFEQDFLSSRVAEIHARSYTAVEYFVDIGIPEDYLRAIAEFPCLNK